MICTYQDIYKVREGGKPVCSEQSLRWSPLYIPPLEYGWNLGLASRQQNTAMVMWHCSSLRYVIYGCLSRGQWEVLLLALKKWSLICGRVDEGVRVARNWGWPLRPKSGPWLKQEYADLSPISATKWILTTTQMGLEVDSFTILPPDMSTAQLAPERGLRPWVEDQDKLCLDSWPMGTLR